MILTRQCTSVRAGMPSGVPASFVLQPVQSHAGVGTGTRLKAKTFYLPEELSEWVQCEASERGVSESEFVRQALAAYREH